MGTGRVLGVVFENIVVRSMTAVYSKSGKVYLGSDIISYSLVSF